MEREEITVVGDVVGMGSKKNTHHPFILRRMPNGLSGKWSNHAATTITE